MFGTSGIRGEYGGSVTAALALDVGRAVASEGADRVVVGRDPRKTGPVLADALAAGLRECGANVVRLGRVATPTLARAVQWYDADVGIAVTASHNPPADNGVKLYDSAGRAIVGERAEAVVSRIQRRDYDVCAWNEIGGVRHVSNATRRHVDALSADRDLDVRAVVDAGNGTGWFVADVLRRAGCRVDTLNAEPDGAFPSRPSEPTAANCTGLADAVAATAADFGVAHDADADRAMAVTESGRFVPGDVLLAVFARAAANPGDTVAVPIDTSMAVADAVGEVGATTTYTRVGDGYVAARATDAGVVFGGEPSGAWVWPDESPCPDGALAALKLAELVADEGALSGLAADVSRRPLRRETVETNERRDVVEHVRDRVADRYANVTNVDGVRVDVENGWFLVRASGTEPLVRITAEASDEAAMTALFRTARDLVDGAVADVGNA